MKKLLLLLVVIFPVYSCDIIFDDATLEDPLGPDEQLVTVAGAWQLTGYNDAFINTLRPYPEQLAYYQWSCSGSK